MKTSEIENMNTEAILAKLNDAREETMKLRFQQSTGELTDYTRLRFIRRDIARMLTELNKRSRASQTEGEK
jgi:large subunit ribosomal protein L29